MERKTIMPSLLALQCWPAINTSGWRASFSVRGMGTSLPSLVHSSVTYVQSGKGSESRPSWRVGAAWGVCVWNVVSTQRERFWVVYVNGGVPVCFGMLLQGASLCRLLLSPPVISSFKTPHMYSILSALSYEDCMNASLSKLLEKERSPISLLQQRVCYISSPPKKIDFDFSKDRSSQCCLPVSMHDRLSSNLQGLR